MGWKEGDAWCERARAELMHKAQHKVLLSGWQAKCRHPRARSCPDLQLSQATDTGTVLFCAGRKASSTGVALFSLLLPAVALVSVLMLLGRGYLRWTAGN